MSSKTTSSTVTLNPPSTVAKTKEALDFNKEGESTTEHSSSSSSPSERKEKKKYKKSKSPAKKRKEVLSNSEEPPLRLPQKTSPNKLTVNAKTGSSIPFCTPSDYQDFDALEVSLSALWDDDDWSNEELNLSVENLCQRDRK